MFGKALLIILLGKKICAGITAYLTKKVTPLCKSQNSLKLRLSYFPLEGVKGTPQP